MPRSRPKLPGKTQLTDLQVDGTTVVVDETNNRLGIGTSSPASTVESEGSSGDLILEIDNNASNSANFQIQNGAGNARVDLVMNDGSANTTITMKGQKVGIGDTSPSYTLDVGGNAQIVTDLLVGGSVSLQEKADAISDTAAYGQLWVKTATPNQLYFTTDAGDDIQITSGTAMAVTGDITGVTAGDGLSGGGTSGGVSLALDLKSNGGLEIQSGEASVAQGISQHDVAQFAASVADNDFLRIDGTAVEGLSAAEVAAAIEGSIDAVGTIASGTWQGTAIARAYIANDAINGDKIDDDAIDSEHYANGSIDTDHIADNQVTLAKMAGLARGKIIYGNASGDPTALAVGNANQVLATDGTDIAWTDPSGTASNDADLILHMQVFS